MNNAQKNIGRIVSMAGQGSVNTTFAPEMSGEMVFLHAMRSEGEVLTTPVKYLLGGMGRLLKGLKEVFKDKRKLIPSIVLAAVWMLMTVLSMLKINSSWIDFLNFITFARGGMGGGIPGVIGGTIGKGVLSYFIFTFVIPVFSGRKPFAGMGGGIKTLFSSLFTKDLKTIIPLLFGGGGALMVYNFLTGSATLENSMVGIAAFLVSVKALSAKTGFLNGFLTSIVSKVKRGKPHDANFANKLIAGWAGGFMAAVALSAFSQPLICYVFGAAAAATAVILVITSQSKGKVAA